MAEQNNNQNKPPSEVEKERERQAVDKVKFARSQQGDLANAQRRDLERSIADKEREAAEKERKKRLGLKEGKPVGHFLKGMQRQHITEAHQIGFTRVALSQRIRQMREAVREMESILENTDTAVWHKVDPSGTIAEAIGAFRRAEHELKKPR
jgi:hypothetical protein